MHNNAVGGISDGIFYLILKPDALFEEVRQ